MNSAPAWAMQCTQIQARLPTAVRSCHHSPGGGRETRVSHPVLPTGWSSGTAWATRYPAWKRAGEAEGWRGAPAQVPHAKG